MSWSRKLPAALAAFLLALLAAGVFAAAPAGAPGGIAKPQIALSPLVFLDRQPDKTEFELLLFLVAYERDHNRTSLAIRPFYYRERDPDKDSERRHFLWPLSVYKRTGQERSLWILPLFWRHSNPEMSRTLLFPLWHHKREGEKTRLGVIGYIPITLFDFQRDPIEDSTYHRYLLWTYRRHGASSELSFLPLYEQAKSPGVRSYSLIPLFAYYRNEASDSTRFSMLGLPDTFNLFERRRQGHEMLEWHFLILYRHVSTEARRLVLFPLYWDLRRGSDRLFHVWPLYGRNEKGSSIEYSTVWPLFRWRTDDGEDERDVNLFWPLMRSFSGPREKRHVRFFPLFAMSSDPHSEERPPLLAPGLISPLPLWYRARGEGYDYSRFLWLAWWADNDKRKMAFVLTYYSVEDKTDLWRHRGVFPLWHASQWDDKRLVYGFPTFVSYSDTDSTLRTLFPLYYHYGSKESAWDAIFPLYFGYRSEARSLRVLFPLYYYSKNVRDDSEFAYYFPLYGTLRRGAKVRRHLFLFPLFARFHDDEMGYRSWDALWPMLHHDAAKGAGSTRVLPLYWSGHDPESSFRVAFPLYWEFNDAFSSQRHLLPLFGRYTNKEGLSVRYLGGPLFIGIEKPSEQYSKRAYLGLLAGSSSDYETRRSYVFPFYWMKTSPGESRFFLLPLFGRETVAPQYSMLFFLGFKRNINLFEFSRDPGAGFSESRALLYYARRDGGEEKRVLFPLYWHWKGDATGLDLTFPLYARQWDKEKKQRELSLLGLHDGLSLFHFLRNETEPRRLDRVLVFGRDRRGEKTTRYAFPLFWDLREPGRHRSLFFPFYNYGSKDDDDQRRLGILGFTPVFSLFTWRDEPGAAVTRLWPLFGYRARHREGEKELGVLGVYYPASIVHFRWGPEVYDHHLFPLYDYERRGAAGSPERTVKGALLWQVVSYRREGAGTSDFRFLWRLVRKQRSPGRRAFEFNPFYLRIVEEGKGSYWAVLGGLVGRETKADGTKDWRFLWFL